MCVCVRKSPIKTTKMSWEVTFTRLKISGCDLGSLVGETTGNSGRDFVSHENVDSKMMNSDSLIHIPGIQKWRQ